MVFLRDSYGALPPGEEGSAVAKPSSIDPALQQLYQVAPEAFTAARNQLAKELTEAGSSELAQKVRSRSKPTLATWALNQVGRESGREVDALFDAGDRIRRAQTTALRGNRDGADQLRQASQEEQKLIALLLGRAAEAIKKLGHAASAATLGRIEGTLRALALTPGEARQLLKTGILDKELQYTGFPGSLEMSEVGPPPKAAPKVKGKPDLERIAEGKKREENKRAAAERRAAEHEVGDWERKVQRSQALAAHLEQIATRAEHSARQARQNAEQAKRSADEDQRRLARARDDLASLVQKPS